MPCLSPWHGGLSASSASFADGTPHLLETGPLDRSLRRSIKMSASPGNWSRLVLVTLGESVVCVRHGHLNRLCVPVEARRLRSSDLQRLSDLHGAGLRTPTHWRC